MDHARTPPSRLAAVGLVGLGAVGTRVARQLAPVVDHLAVLETRPALVHAMSRDLPVRLASGEQLGACDLVVLAHPVPHADLAASLLRPGRCIVSTSDDASDVLDLLQLDEPARRQGCTLVVGAAASPGLTGLIARELATRLDSVDELHVAVHGTGGPDCARQHHRQLGGTALGWHDGQWVKRPAGSGRELCWFPEPIGGRDCYRAELADPILLHRSFPDAARITARMSANRRDRLTARLPMLTPPHVEGGIGGLRVEARGTRGDARATEVAGVAERVAIAAAAVAAATAVAWTLGDFGSSGGVAVLGGPGHDHRPLLDDVIARGVRVDEYVGADLG